MNGLLADKLKESGNEDWTWSVHFCHMEKRTRCKEGEGKKERAIMRYRKKEQDGMNKKEKAERSYNKTMGGTKGDN